MTTSEIRRLLLAGCLCLGTAAAYGAAPVTLQITKGETAILSTAPAGTDDGVQSTELDSIIDGDGTDIRGGSSPSIIFTRHGAVIGCGPACKKGSDSNSVQIAVMLAP